MNSVRQLRLAPARSWLAALVVLALAATACGASGTGSTPSPSPSPAVTITTPRSTASPVSVTFKLNGINTTATGTITVTNQQGQLLIELKITGLQPMSSHVSHIHVGSCASRGGIKYALNQVLADGQGVADVASTVNAAYPPASGTWYVVVHTGPDMQGANAFYLLCGNLFK